MIDFRSIYGHIDFLGEGATTVAEDVCQASLCSLAYVTLSHSQESFAHNLRQNPDLSFMCASDVWLDSPKTLRGLRKILDGYVGSGFIPLVFILCGNFTSKDVSRGSGLELVHYQGVRLFTLTRLC